MRMNMKASFERCNFDHNQLMDFWKIEKSECGQNAENVSESPKRHKSRDLTPTSPHPRARH